MAVVVVVVVARGAGAVTSRYKPLQAGAVTSEAAAPTATVVMAVARASCAPCGALMTSDGL